MQRIKQLTELPNDQGLEWLCRLVRFEKSPTLSKQAALEIIGEEVEPGEAAWNRRVATIAKTLDHARRPGVQWLLAYVQSQSDPVAALDRWSALTEAERKTLDEHPQETQNQIVFKLLRRKIDMLDRLGRRDETLAVMNQMVLCERGDSASLTELVTWLAGRQAWSVIDNVATRFAASFDVDALLMYTLCDARVVQGNQELADQLAAQALKISGDNVQEHNAVVERLIDRGMAAWAERELRYIIALGPIGSVTDVRARHHLADNLLHDQERDQEAALVFKALLDAADEEAAVMQRVRSSCQQLESPWRRCVRRRSTTSPVTRPRSTTRPSSASISNSRWRTTPATSMP